MKNTVRTQREGRKAMKGTGAVHYRARANWTDFEWSPAQELFSSVCLCNITCPHTRYRSGKDTGRIYWNRDAFEAARKSE